MPVGALPDGSLPTPTAFLADALALGGSMSDLHPFVFTSIADMLALGAGVTGVHPYVFTPLSDGLRFGLSGVGLHTVLLRAKLALDAELPTSLDGVSSLRDELALEVGLGLVFRELLADSLALGADQALTYTAIARMVDALLLAEVVNTAAEAITVIEEALAFGALAGALLLAPMSDGLGLSAAAEAAYTAIARMLDSVSLDAAMTPRATLAIALRDNVALGAAQSTSLDALSLMRDQLDFVLQVTVDNEQYVAWTMNTASKASSRYTNYPFNSFMKLGERCYGVTDTGRYLLEGDDDAGAPIAAKLRLGISQLNSRMVKGIDAAYLGYTAAGDLLLKVVKADSTTGAREAHVYRLYATGAGSMREGRVKVGKGLEAVYYDFQVENVDGAAFDVDVIEIIPVAAQRRVRGNAGGKP
jgi:hypothetical protein